MQKRSTQSTPSTRLDIWGLTLALCFPSILTWIYFVALADAETTIQQVVYTTGKVAQFAFPLFFLAFVVREPLRLPFHRRHGLVEGILSGLVILASIVSLWRLLVWIDSPLLADLVPNISAKVVGLGVATPWRYAALGFSYSLFHTFLEEYYWRWFVFGRLRRHAGFGLSITLSSVGFMAHHVIVMGAYAGWTSPYTYLFSVAVAVGGGYWAWLYERSETLVAPWVSHLFVDVAVFSVGFALLS